MTPSKIIVLVLFLIPLSFFSSCERKASARSMTVLTEDERRQKFEDDLKLVRRYDAGLTETLRYAKARPDLFVKSEEIQLTPRQKEELRVIWQTVLDYMRGLDGVKGYWRDFHRFNVIGERRAHTEAFTAGYVAWLTQYRHGLDFIELTVPSKPMEKLLDEGAAAHEIPAGAFGLLKWNVIHVKAVSRLMGSHQYYKTVAPSLKDYDCDRKPWCNWSIDAIEQYHEGAKGALKDRAAIEFSYNAFDIARDMSFDAWFPVQAGVAQWMGDTKVLRLHEHLISEQQLETMRQHLEPGDVVVARHNWYLSNVGLPGFWPHAELYIAAPEELASYFDDEAVNAHFQSGFGVENLSTYLEKTYPEAWKEYNTPIEGKPRRVIEAISEGVVLNSLERAAGADYVGVMRPTRGKVDKALAVARAFELWGRPYDFNFDFTTDEALVCTELVYKSWRGAEVAQALGISTEKVMGRVTLPANDIVRQFDEMCDAPQPALEFVYFLDGREKQKSAVVGTREAFRATWKRPKWDTMQE